VNQLKRRFLLNALKLFDLGLVVLAFGLAAFFVEDAPHRVSFARLLAVRVTVLDCVLFAVSLLICHGIFSLCNFYKSKRLAPIVSEFAEAIRAISLSTVCLGLVAALSSVKMITLPFLALFWLIGSTALTGSRLLMRYLLGTVRRRGHNLRNILILGTNSRAMEFANRIAASPEQGYRLLGFVDENWPGMEVFSATNFKRSCDYEELADFLRRNVVDEVAIYIPLKSLYGHAAHAAELCERHGIAIRFASDIFGLKTARSRMEEFEGDHHVAAYTGVREGWPIVIKRTLDILISLTLILLLAPVLLIVAALIKLSSKGPIFFRQKRLGLNKRVFSIYKFRSMVPNAEEMITALEELNEVSGPVFKIKNDPRITPIGKFMRRTSIDELPQLLNILKGEMSLVGPRPLPVRDYEGFNQDWQLRRFSVRPGITCLWQVNGRSAIPFEQWMRLDLQYMDEWSLWLDLKILARTIPAVLTGSGAA